MNIKSLFLLTFIILFISPFECYSQVPDLKTVSEFILFTSNGALTNTGATITGGGNIGTNSGGITGFDTDTEYKHTEDAETKQCSIDLQNLFNEITGIPITKNIADTDLPLRGTYTAGVYSVGKAVTLGITLTMDAQNNPDALFIFKVTGAFSSAAGTKIILTNGALAKNVYFNVDGAISFGAGASMKGTFISKSGAIDLASGAALEGRALTMSGAVSLYQNIVMTTFTPVPVFTVTQPNILSTTGTIIISYPIEKGMSYSIDGINYTNTSGIFSRVPSGSYTITAKDSLGCVSAGSKVKIVPFLNLGVNADFAIFTIDGKVENTGAMTQVTGNVGNQTGLFIFSLGKICGQINSGDSVSLHASDDLIKLNNDLTNIVSDTIIGTVFGNGQILRPKVYGFGAALLLNGELTLDAQGDPNALFIFKINGAFKALPNSKIIFKNSASMCNVYWQVVGAITLEENSDFRGNIVSTGAIIFEEGSTLHGRALSTTGAITINDNVKINILPNPTITVIQPTDKISTGTIIITAPLGTDLTYSIDGVDHSNKTGIFTGLPKGSYIVTASNTDCSSCPGTTVVIALPSWTGAENNDWNNTSNWNTNSVPTAEQDITIFTGNKYPVLNMNPGLSALCHNLTIEPGAVLTINPGNFLTVNGTITNKAGVSGIVIKASPIVGIPNGTLIFNNLPNDSIVATVEMYSKASWDMSQMAGSIYKWQFFGVPFRSIIAYPSFSGSYVRKYCESGNTSASRWIPLQNESILTSFTGYEIVQESPKIFTLTGVLENGSLTKRLTSTIDATFPGLHLIVNPYTAAIDITKLIFGEQTEATVYIYNTGTLKDWESSSPMKYDSVNNNPGQYSVATLATAGKVPGIPGQIPSMGAFLVKAMSNSPEATLNISYSSVVMKNQLKQSAPAFHPSEITDKPKYTRIDVKGSRFSDCVWLFSVPTCTHNFDNGWDGRKMQGSSLTPQLFAMETDGNYQINAVDNINNSYLGFQAGEDTRYTLTFTHENTGIFNTQLYLQDLTENKMIDITKSGTEYIFDAPQSGLPVKRFKIITSPYLSGNDDNALQIKIFNYEHSIFIQNYSEVDGDVVLYDMTGRCRQKSTFTASSMNTIQTSLEHGVYIVHAKNKAGIERNQLVVI